MGVLFEMHLIIFINSSLSGRPNRSLWTPSGIWPPRGPGWTPLKGKWTPLREILSKWSTFSKQKCRPFGRHFCLEKQGGEIRIKVEGPGGAFIDQCKHWSIRQFAPTHARRKHQNLSISAIKEPRKVLLLAKMAIVETPINVSSIGQSRFHVT